MDQPKLQKSLGVQFKAYPHIPIKVLNDFSSFPSLQGLEGVLFCLGQEPLEALAQEKLVPKGRKVTGLRNQPISLPLTKMRALVSYSPGVQVVDYAHYVDLQCDTSMALRYHETGSMAPVYGKYEYVHSFDTLRKFIEDQYEGTQTQVDVALDLETVGLDPYLKPTLTHPGAYVVSIQMSVVKGESAVLRFQNRGREEAWFSSLLHVADLAWILTTPKVKMKGANLKYDLHWLWVRGGLVCTNFVFDTTLVGSLLDENRSNGLDVHAKVYVPSLAGYCVAPDTRLWMGDLSWSKASGVKVGDTLVGFDEHSPSTGRRVIKKSAVLSVQRLNLLCYDIVMSSGTKMRVSANHMWLVNMGEKGGNLRWMRTEDPLLVGKRIKRVTEVIPPGDDFDSGWFSGVLDGEGWTTKAAHSNSFRLGFAQKPGLVLDRALSIAGNDFTLHITAGKSCHNVTCRGSYGGLLVLQKYRPIRLLDHGDWWGCTLPQEYTHDFVVSATPVGVQEVVSIKTSTSTFIAEGLASHNSDEFDRTVDKSRIDLVPPEKLLSYAGGDSDATLQVADVMKQELLKDRQLTSFYVNIMHPAARAFESVEQGGVLVSRERLLELEADLNTEILQLIAQAKGVLGGRVVAKHYDPDKLGGLNLTKASMITDYMFSPMGLNLKPKVFTERTKAPSTGLDHLLQFEDVPEAKAFINVIKDYASATKTLSTYVVGFMKHIRSDGRMHPSYWFFAGNKDEGEGGTNCMPAGELVLTDRGYLPVESVQVGDQVISHTGRIRRVTATVDNGVQPIVTVTLANGLELRTTPNHKYLVGGGVCWVQAIDLEPGDPIVVHSGKEEWKVVPDWEDFRVSTWGRVFNTKTGKFLTQNPKEKWGHLKVCLYRNGAQSRGEDRKDFSVHGLMARVFHVPGKGDEIRHLNGIAWDDTLGNLRWGTSKGNRQDAVNHGTMNRRTGAQAKLCQAAVDFIRAQPVATRHHGWANKALSERFGVCERLIRAVRAGQRGEARDYGGKEAKFSLSEVVRVVLDTTPVRTYGLTVEVDESHVTGGIVTHNTGRLSCHAPTFQCLRGSSLVLTDTGAVSIESIVMGYEGGKSYRVLTHTGAWREVVGVYRNGVQPVFDVSFETGIIVGSTENHPYLTSRGWVRTDQLLPGDICYAAKRDRGSTSDAGVHQSNVPLMGGHEESLHQSNQQGLAEVRGSWHHVVPPVGGVLQVPGRHGGEALQGYVGGAVGREQQLRTGKLCLGYAQATGEQQDELQEDRVEWADQDRSRVGVRSRDQSGTVALSVIRGDADGASLDERDPWDRDVFQEIKVVAVVPAGECETFDLTIEGSHSFVANGVVVHNTVPKHTKWAKRIRRCYIAPDGHLVVERDYSQGELKVVACVANEQVMLQAYKDGKDLHVITGGKAAGLTYEEMMALKVSDPELFAKYRQQGKPGNFGLLYGMGAEGFQIYAFKNYGVYFTMEEATAFHAAFFATYPRLLTYHSSYKAMAKKEGQVRSPLGRIRHLPLITSPNREVASGAERQAINSPIQGTLSDMLIWTIALEHKQGLSKVSPCFGAIHDAAYNYIPEDQVDIILPKQLEIMENLPFHLVGWNPQLKFTADAKIGLDMAYLKGYERV